MRRGRPAPRTPVSPIADEGTVTPTDQSTDQGTLQGTLQGAAEGTASRAGKSEGELPRRATELRTLPGRLEWNAAMARESARAARYRTPASIAIVELRHRDPKVDVTPFMRALAGPIARVLREDSRATDLVARVATSRFQLLLPETSEAGAERLAERLAARCRGHVERTGAPVAIRVSVAGTGLQDTLQDALAHALRSIEAA